MSTGAAVLDLLPERLRRRIEVSPDGCWLWTGHINRGGYGILGARPRPLLAHRLVWEALKGLPPEVLHHDPDCPKSCVNPEHLSPTTNSEHPDSAPAWQSSKTHCAQGHKFTEANTYRPARGGRICRRCRRENMQRYSRGGDARVS